MLLVYKKNVRGMKLLNVSVKIVVMDVDLLGDQDIGVAVGRKVGCLSVLTPLTKFELEF